MACEPVNLTSEDVKNILMNKGFLFDVNKDTTVDELRARLKYLNDNTRKPVEGDDHYRLFGVPFEERVSNIRQKAFKGRRTKAAVEKEWAKPDFNRGRDAGTRVHSIEAEIMDHLYNNIGDYADIKARAGKGDYALTGDNFKQAEDLVREHINTINKIQNKINESTGRKDKATVSTEQVLLSAQRNIGGAADVFVAFSDKTYGIIDYKTVRPISWGDHPNYVDGQLIDDPMGYQKVSDYELSMNEYNKIAREDLGFGENRLSRLSPVLLQLEQKPLKEQAEFDSHTEKIRKIDVGSARSPFLKPIPVGEHTNYEGINTQIKRQYSLLGQLSQKLNDRTVSQADRELVRRQMKSIRKAIQNTIIDGDISDLLKSSKGIMENIQKRVNEPELIDGKNNPKYMDDAELGDAISELSIYKDIIANTQDYYGDVKEKNPELYNKLKTTISATSANVQTMLSIAQIENTQRILKEVGKYNPDSVVKDADGRLKLVAQREVEFLKRNFYKISNINHPVFRTAWKMLQAEQYDLTHELEDIVNNINTKEDAVFGWAKEHNMNRMDALRLLVDEKTGYLHSKVSQELRDLVSKAYSRPDSSVGAKELRSLMEIKDVDKFKEDYEARKERFVKTISARYEEGEGSLEFQRELRRWTLQNDMINSDAAFVNEFKRGWLSYKPEIEAKYRTSEYKNIRSNKVLSDYYDMYSEYNNKFRQMLNISNYWDLPDIFVANVRKSMIDHLTADKFNPVAAMQEFYESLQMRDGETHIGNFDDSGALKKTIPMLYMQPFFNADGEIDLTQKSYDLSRNLAMFAKMAFSWKHMHELEPRIQQLRDILANQSNTMVQSRTGKGIIGAMGDVMTKKGLDTDTSRLFNELMDAYVYGTRFQDMGSMGKVDYTKVILKLKRYYGASTLGFAVIPSFGAMIAGNIQLYFEGGKGIAYTREKLNQSHYHLVTEHDKYTALALSYHTYGEDPTQALIDNESANWFAKIFTYRNIHYPLRRAHEVINDSILNAMALNWGIDTEGKLGTKGALVRLNDPGRNTEGIRSIWDLTSLDKTTGKLTIEGLNKENYIEFREAARETYSHVLGSMSQDDLSRIDTNLLYNSMFQFRPWMVGVVRERLGGLEYDPALQAGRWGRYKAALKEFQLTDQEIETGYASIKYMADVFLPNMAKFTMDLATFGLSTKMGIGRGGKWVDAQGVEYLARGNPKRAYRMYVQYMSEHPDLSKERFTFNHFLEIKEGQMRAFVSEARAVLMFATAMHLMGSGGGAGGQKKEPPYMANWFSRFMYKNMTKADERLTNMWSPVELLNIAKNPIPMTGILNRTVSTGMAGFRHMADLVTGEQAVRTEKPLGFYTLQWMYGGQQIARLMEFYKQYKKPANVMAR